MKKKTAGDAMNGWLAVSVILGSCLGACVSSSSSRGAGGNGSQAGSGGSGGEGQPGGSGGSANAGGGGGGGVAGAGQAGGGGASTAGSGAGGVSGSGGTGVAGAAGSADASVAPMDAGAEAPGDTGGVEAISGTPDGGAYSRKDWTGQSMPPYAVGAKALNMDLKYTNAFDGNFNTRWSIGSTNSPAQTIGDEFTFDMLVPHTFRKVLFWAGGENGVNGPDPRDYPGALDLTTSNDCVTFGPTLASGNEPQPGCSNCTMPFVITLSTPATARCVRLTLTKRQQVGGPIWWAISELFVYP